MNSTRSPKLKQRFMAGAATMGVARIIEQALAFARNLIIANLLGADNQGIAATFAIVLSFLEMSSDFSAGRLIVQAEDGEDTRLQASLHLWEIARGLLLGVLLFAAAGQIARFFNADYAEWAFRLLALVPVIKGFEHLDLRRFQRQMRFGRFAASSLIPQFLTAAAAWPLAKWLGDYSAALCLVMLQAAGTLAASHLLAVRPYRVALNPAHIRRLVNFGLPLLLNGIVLFAVQQGDRVIIGRFYTPADLGVYSVAAGLAMMAGNLLMSMVSPLALPALAQVRGDRTRQQLILGKLMELSLLCAVPIAVGFVVLGPLVLRLIYSDDYRPAEAYIGILGLAAAVRMLRVVPNAAQMAQGDNMALFHASISRLIGTLLALPAAIGQHPLIVIAWCGVAGELAAILTTAVLLKRHQGVGLRALAVALAMVLIWSGGGWLATLVPLPDEALWTKALYGVAVCAALMGILVLARPMLRKEIAAMAPAIMARLRSPRRGRSD